VKALNRNIFEFTELFLNADADALDVVTVTAALK